jgi:hypothetical protein
MGDVDEIGAISRSMPWSSTTAALVCQIWTLGTVRSIVPQFLDPPLKHGDRIFCRPRRPPILTTALIVTGKIS